MGVIYEFLLADIGLGIIWLVLFLKFKGLRKEMKYGSVLYAVILVPLFLISKGLSFFVDITWRYVPDFYNPDTLFNLSRITGGLAIEDVLFMIFAGGIISIIYELTFKSKAVKNVKKRQHVLSIIAFVVSYILIAIFFEFNPIYNLSISSFVGFLVIAFQRKDLIEHSIKGALAFTLFYLVFGILFVLILLDSPNEFWNLANISGILVFNFPIEELLFAFSFGLMWAPMYEYIKGFRMRSAPTGPRGA